MLTTSHVLIQVPSNFVQSTPCELCNSRKLNPSNLRPWGSVAYVHTPHKCGKLSPKGRKCVFIRYNEHFKGYVFISEHEDEIVIELELHYVTFLEDNFLLWLRLIRIYIFMK